MTETNSLRRQPSAIAGGVSFYFATLILAVCLSPPGAYGQTSRPGHAAPKLPTSMPDHHIHAPSATGLDSGDDTLADREETTVAIPDITVTDQDNHKLSLYTDLMKDKLVVLNFFYTTCTGGCPMAGMWLSNLQERLGARLGKSVALVSISIDPDVDTPEKVKQWSLRWKRRPGWSLLTSPDQNLRALIAKFRAYESKGMHSAIVFIGDGAQNPIKWVDVDIMNEGRFLLNYLEKAKVDDPQHENARTMTH